MEPKEGYPAGGVRITAPARLHLGFLDLNGSLGRRFGSLGVALDWPVTQVTVRRSSAYRVRGPDRDRAEAAIARLADAINVKAPVEVIVDEALPPHCGLGSGTQLRLAVGMGLSAVHGIGMTPRDVGRILDRGQRSAIGIGAFETGGFILDGGRGPRDDTPPIISRVPVPADWRFLLVQDSSVSGLSGSDEARAIIDLPPFPDELAGHLCRLVVMKALPALHEADSAGFGSAVSEMQRKLGDHFAAAQGGRFTSKVVADVLQWAQEHGADGVGQSSWGPTGFIIIGNSRCAGSMLDEARRRWRDSTSLAFDLVQGNNRGADIAQLAGLRPEPAAQGG